MLYISISEVVLGWDALTENTIIKIIVALDSIISMYERNELPNLILTAIESDDKENACNCSFNVLPIIVSISSHFTN